MDRVDYQPVIVQDLINWHKNDELNLFLGIKRKRLEPPFRRPI